MESPDKYVPSLISYLETKGENDLAQIVKRSELRFNLGTPGLLNLIFRQKEGIFVRLSSEDYHFLELNKEKSNELVNSIMTIVKSEYSRISVFLEIKL